MEKKNCFIRRAKLTLRFLFILVMTCGISACTNTKDVTNEIENKVTATEVPPTDQVKDSEPASPDTNIQEHDAGYYLNSNEAVIFQQATWNFAKAYFSANKEELTKYLASGVVPEVWDQDVFNQLSRLILKWNPQELSFNKAMDVQYEFMLEGEDSVTYLGMVLEYQNENWFVTSYYLEK